MIDKIVLRVLKKSILLNFCPDQQAKANKPRVGGSTLDNQLFLDTEFNGFCLLLICFVLIY